MQKILSLATKVKACSRPLLNDQPIVLPPAKKPELEASLATLENTCYALQYYEEHRLGQRWGPLLTGRAYLHLYGTLQPVFLQQEAVRGLHRSLVDEDINPEANTAWQRIRALRNATVAHPINLKNGSEKVTRHYTISKRFFEGEKLLLVYWDSNKQRDLAEVFDLPSLYASYKREVIEYLERISRCSKLKRN